MLSLLRRTDIFHNNYTIIVNMSNSDTIIMGHCGGNVYVLLMAHGRWAEIAWQSRDTIEVRATTVANLAVACGGGQSLWWFCGE